MGKETGIAWTDHTFNPWWGCTKISPACDHCYAETWAKRLGMAIWGVDAPRRLFGPKHWNEPVRWNKSAGERGVRERVFCASMADVFESRDDVPRDALWTLVESTPHLHWQLLTKRIGNVARMVPPKWMHGFWPSNVWIGATIANQEEADRDISKLLALPARVRFVSYEPALGPVTWTPFLPRRMALAEIPAHALDAGCTEGFTNGIEWLIVGGESGGKARSFYAAWAREAVSQCRSRNVPVFVKQMGSRVLDRNDAGFDGCDEQSWPLRPDGCDPDVDFEPHTYVERYQGADCRIKLVDRAGADPAEWPEDLRVQEFP
jgi:protein gp37